MTRGILPVLVLALGCSDSTGPAAGDALGTFRATLSGALAQTATGTATYGVGLYSYRVDLEQKPDGAGFTLFFNADGGRPTVGTFALAPITSPQMLPTVNAQACADYTSPCRLVWGVHSEPPPGAGRLEITESRDGAHSLLV